MYDETLTIIVIAPLRLCLLYRTAVNGILFIFLDVYIMSFDKYRCDLDMKNKFHYLGIVL